MEQKSVFSGITDKNLDERMAIGLADAGQTRLMDIKKIIPNAMQPRRSYSEDKLESLAESIKKNGILQPILVKPRGDSYLIVAGERRWRAAEMAGLRQVPVIIHDDDDGASMDEIAITENMQRENLNPVDEVFAIKELFQRGRNAEDIMIVTSRSRRHIASARRVAKFFEQAMAGGFATYESLKEACTTFGLGTLEQAARIAESTGDLQAAMDVLEKGSVAVVRETAEIAVAEVEEQAQEDALSASGASQDNNGNDTGGASLTVPTQPEPVEAATVAEPAVTEPVVMSEATVAEPETQGPHVDKTEIDPLDPFATSGPVGEPPVSQIDDGPAAVTVEELEQAPGEGAHAGDEITGDNDTKITQNGENDLLDPVLEDGTEPGKTPDTEHFFSGAPEESFQGSDTPVPGPENLHKVSGKLLLKQFTSLKELLEEMSGLSGASFKVRENHREALANVVRDVEFLLPSLSGAISAIEAHLAASGRRN